MSTWSWSAGSSEPGQTEQNCLQFWTQQPFGQDLHEDQTKLDLDSVYDLSGLLYKLLMF